MSAGREPREDSIAGEDRALRLGREWYAEIRAKHADDDPKRRRREDGGGSGDGSWFDWLSGGDGECGGGDGGD